MSVQTKTRAWIGVGDVSGNAFSRAAYGMRQPPIAWWRSAIVAIRVIDISGGYPNLAARLRSKLSA